jgi:transmembrane sensor
MTPSAEQIRGAVAQQAGDWFVANQAGPLKEADRAAFVAWLKASPIHVGEYLGVALIAHDLPAATTDPDIPLDALIAQARADASDTVVALDAPLPTREPPAKRLWVARAWPLVASATAAVVLLVASVAWWSRDGELLGLPKTYRTTHGEQLAQRLPDGTWLHLNTDSAVTVRFSRTERVVDVDRGQALFQVAHDGRRWFRVAAGGAQVVAVGTQFDVYRKINNATLITVVDGTVGVLLGDAPPLTREAVLPARALRVSAGQQLGIDAGKMWAHPVAADLRVAVGWLQRRIVFEKRPLSEVADEFNRYAKIPIEIDDPALRDLPVSGAFDAYDTDSFVRFLTTLDGVAVQRTATRIHVISSSTRVTTDQ